MAREYLQARILESLQRAGAMVSLAFHGGTALRFLFGSPRYSEDLDFALEGRTADYSLRKHVQAIRRDLTLEGYAVNLKVNDRRTVHSAFVRFPGLLFELGLSGHRSQAFAVKIEVDTEPPPGAVLATTVIRRHVTLQLQHHDRASLLAGKLHALLQRPYTKGRDVYDLLWYLSDPTWPAPNVVLLQNTLRQTGWAGPEVNGENWRELVWGQLELLSWDQVVADVQPFLETGAGLDLLTLENLRRVLAATW